MTAQNASSRSGTYNRLGVRYSDHNGRDLGKMPPTLRLRALADHLDQACGLTSTAERSLYLRLRREWVEVEAAARRAEASHRHTMELASPVLFPTGDGS